MSGSHTLKKNVLFASTKALDEFFFHLESSPRSQGVQIFVLTFWPYKKDGLIRKVNFKIYDVTAWLTNSYITHIAQYLTN